MNHVPLRERNKLRMFERIIEAALTLFRTLGYDQPTMEAIVEQAEMNFFTLYRLKVKLCCHLDEFLGLLSHPLDFQST